MDRNEENRNETKRIVACHTEDAKRVNVCLELIHAQPRCAHGGKRLHKL